MLFPTLLHNRYTAHIRWIGLFCLTKKKKSRSHYLSTMIPLLYCVVIVLLFLSSSSKGGYKNVDAFPISSNLPKTSKIRINSNYVSSKKQKRVVPLKHNPKNNSQQRQRQRFSFHNNNYNILLLSSYLDEPNVVNTNTNTNNNNNNITKKTTSSNNQMINALTGVILVGSVFWGITNGNVEELSMTESVIEVIAPQTATDVIAVSLGEGLGGLVGAAATRWLSSNSGGAAASSSLTATTDYFITRAAALPLFLSLGFNALSASIFATFLASVPYEAVKYQSRLKQRAQQEKQLLDDLLKEEEELLKRKNKQSLLFMPFGGRNVAIKKKQQVSVNVTQLEDAVLPTQFDVPEIISDVLIWLEYAVLDSNFGDMLFFPSFPVMIQPAIFGALAALSSQLYLDALYRFTDWGPEEKTQIARDRTVKDIFAGYGSACLNSATLFGVYELVRKPTGMLITNLLSGGLESCVGSSDYDVCMETFELDYVFSTMSVQPLTLPAEVRALIVAIFSLLERLLGNN